MITVWLSIGVALLAFAFGVSGLSLQRLLPEPHTSDRSRAMIRAIVSLISLLLALVLGTLVGSAYSFYANQKSEIETFAARAIHLDLALAEYGPETTPARARMKQQLLEVREMVWGENAVEAANALAVGEPLPHIRWLDEYVASLDPRTPAQRQFAAAAASDLAAVEQTRLLIALQLASSISWPLVVIVVSWALILFFGYGVLSRVNATTLTALGLGAFAVGSALFLILQLSQPFTGVFRMSSAAFDEMLASLDE